MRHLCQKMFDAGYVQASDREDTGQWHTFMQKPRANSRRLIDAVAGMIYQPLGVSPRLSRLSAI